MKLRTFAFHLANAQVKTNAKVILMLKNDLLPVVLICIQTFAVHLANEKLIIKSRNAKPRAAVCILSD
jgi:hypothetical protein